MIKSVKKRVISVFLAMVMAFLVLPVEVLSFSESEGKAFQKTVPLAKQVIQHAPSTYLQSENANGIHYFSEDIFVDGRDKNGNVVSRINLSKDTITLPAEGYTIQAFSTDGGNQWKNISPTSFSNSNFSKMLNRDFTLWLTDKYNTQTRQPPNDANIVRFATIGARPKTPRLAVNYDFGLSVEEYQWAVVSRERGANPTEAVVKGIGVAKANDKGTAVSDEGYGTYYDGITLAKLSGNRATRSRYYVRTEPTYDGTTYTAASRPARITVNGEQRAPKYRVNYRTETIKLREGDVIFAGTLEDLDNIGYWDIREITTNTAAVESGQLLYITAAKGSTISVSDYLSEEAQTLVIWNSGTRRRAPTAKQVYTLAPRINLEALNINGVNGKLSLDRRFETFRSRTNRWERGLPKITANQTLAIRVRPTAKATGAIDTGFAASRPGEIDIEWGVYNTTRNRSGILRATIRPGGNGGHYSITNATVNRSTNAISVEVSTGGVAYLDVKIFEDVVGMNDDLESGQELSKGRTKIPQAVESTFTRVAIPDTLPEYFIIVVYLVSENGAVLCPSFTSIEYTRAYEEFMSKTIRDFDNNKIINLDNDPGNNFMVVSDDVLIVNAGKNGSNYLSVSEGNQNVYTFTSVDNIVSSLKVGDKFVVVSEDSMETYLVEIASITSDSANTLTITSISEPDFEDFFEYMKINMSVEAEVPITPQSVEFASTAQHFENTDSSSFSLMSADTSRLPTNSFTIPFGSGGRIGTTIPTVVSAEGSPIKIGRGSELEFEGELTIGLAATARVKYAPKILSSYAYFEVRVPYVIGIKCDFYAKANFNVKIKLVEAILTALKVTAPLKYITPIDLDIHLQIGANVDISIDIERAGEVGFALIYTRKDVVSTSWEFQKINNKLPTKDDDISIEVEGVCRVAVELNISAFPTSIKDYVFAGISVYSGVEARCAITYNKGGTTTFPERHQCELCARIELYFIGELYIGAYAKIFKLKEIEFEVVKIGDKNSPNLLYNRYISFRNHPDSVHGDKIRSARGTCPNLGYRMTFDPINSKSNTVDALVTVKKNQGGTTSRTGRFTDYFYEGDYTASATSSNIDFLERTFPVNNQNKNQTIKISQRFTPVTSLTLNKNSIDIPIGSFETLRGTVLPTDATNKSLTWNSSNTSVATVIGGTVTALSIGTATITARTADGSHVAECRVTVSPVRATDIRLNKSRTTILKGVNETLTAMVIPSNATNQRIMWSSNNPSVADVNSNGVVRGMAAGKATITATVDGHLQATCDVSITDFPVPVTDITLDKNNITIIRENTEMIRATVLPNESTPPAATNQNVIWSSENPDIATVEGGVVTARKVGTTTITAETVDGGFQASCTVTVTPIRVTRVDIYSTKTETNQVDLFVGDSDIMNHQVSPNNADNKSVTWDSSDESVATVENGYVRALKSGTATITVRTVDGGFTAACAVEVNLRPGAAVGGTVNLQSFGYRSVTFSSNAFASQSNQTIQYLLSDTNSTPDESDGKWDTKLTFEDLTNQRYFLFARTKKDGTHNYGVPQLVYTLDNTGWRIRVDERFTEGGRNGTLSYRANLVGEGSSRHITSGRAVNGPSNGGTPHHRNFDVSVDFAPWAIQSITVTWENIEGTFEDRLRFDLNFQMSGHGITNDRGRLGEFDQAERNGSVSRSFNIW
ncbi:MAG: Ig-like domain-containing protein [Oscillospiraceae bacterium]|nr:Ig-like domain-containing protein [Oscillospiraceae bacterium]